MKTVTIAHIQVTDQLTVKAVPAYGPAGYRATFTASNSDGAGVNIYNWTFVPDTSIDPMSPQCGGSNPCVWNVPVSGTMQVTALVHNRLKKAIVHVDVVPCPQNDSLQDNPDFRRLQRTLWDSSNTAGPNNIRVERAGFLIDSAGVYKTIVGSLNANAALNTACGFNTPVPNLPPGWTIKAIVHTHPWPDYAALTAAGCPTDALGNPLKYGPAARTGWASGDDWNTSATNGWPSYILDFNRVTRIRGDSANVQVVRDGAGNPVLDGNSNPTYAPDSAGLVNHTRTFQRTGGACSATSTRIPLMADGTLWRGETSASSVGVVTSGQRGASRRLATSQMMEGN